ncbi:family 2 encapsulin nanocompartment cargo protein polyprenyl transferase [Amycolatopsis sp. cmx-8-4]|uniref:family 2 encapsulin nanocompartment cargo protein polyprenyl transferase n=1 Tax=Amycolatopsis sp. cmx-8-4 TaxID=2790947 RepID=UPI00397A6D91
MVTAGVRPQARPVSDVLAWGRRVLDPLLHASVDTLPASMRRISGYHLGWWDEHGRPSEIAGGKAIRPALTLLCAQAVTGDPDAAAPAAVAVELVHNHSLLHDDVLDGDVTRRRRTTAWSMFGVNPAILAGDALLSLAFDVLATSDHPAAAEGARILNTAVLNLLDGQSADVEFESRADVGVTECLAMAEGKTAALISGSCALGALFGDGSPRQVAALRAFGHHLGMAFQLVDDLLGIWGDPAVTGKPVHSDLDSRKKSLPVVAALTSDTTAGRELSALYHRDQPFSESDLQHAAELIEEAGGRSWTKNQADDQLTQALRELHTAGTAEPAGAELASLAKLVTHRDH